MFTDAVSLAASIVCVLLVYSSITKRGTCGFPRFDVPPGASYILVHTGEVGTIASWETLDALQPVILDVIDISDANVASITSNAYRLEVSSGQSSVVANASVIHITGSSIAMRSSNVSFVDGALNTTFALTTAGDSASIWIPPVVNTTTPSTIGMVLYTESDDNEATPGGRLHMGVMEKPASGSILSGQTSVTATASGVVSMSDGVRLQFASTDVYNVSSTVAHLNSTVLSVTATARASVISSATNITTKDLYTSGSEMVRLVTIDSLAIPHGTTLVNCSTMYLSATGSATVIGDRIAVSATAVAVVTSTSTLFNTSNYLQVTADTATIDAGGAIVLTTPTCTLPGTATVTSTSVVIGPTFTSSLAGTTVTAGSSLVTLSSSLVGISTDSMSIGGGTSVDIGSITAAFDVSSTGVVYAISPNPVSITDSSNSAVYTISTGASVDSPLVLALPPHTGSHANQFLYVVSDTVSGGVRTLSLGYISSIAVATITALQNAAIRIGPTATNYLELTQFSSPDPDVWRIGPQGWNARNLKTFASPPTVIITNSLGIGTCSAIGHHSSLGYISLTCKGSVSLFYVVRANGLTTIPIEVTFNVGPLTGSESNRGFICTPGRASIAGYTSYSWVMATWDSTKSKLILTSDQGGDVVGTYLICMGYEV